MIGGIEVCFLETSVPSSLLTEFAHPLSFLLLCTPLKPLSLHICTCLAGAPAAVSTPSASEKFARAATDLWKAMRIDADDPLGGGGGGGSDDAGGPPSRKTKPVSSPHPPTAEIDVPSLYRRSVEIDPALDASSANFNRESAYRELFAAQHRAVEAARRAAEAAAAAGIPDYSPPPGARLDGASIPRPDPEHAARAALILRAAAAARASVERKQAAARAVATAPRVCLLAADVPAAAASGASVEVLWPDDGQWWPARVQAGAPGDGGDHLLYGTGEQERGVDLRAMAAAGEIAWSGPERARCLELYREKQLEAERVKKARKAERAAAKRAAAAQLADLQQQQHLQQQLQVQMQQHQQQQQLQQHLQQQQLQQQQLQQQQRQMNLNQPQRQQHQQHISVQALIAAGAATRGAVVAIRLAATGQVLRGAVLGPVHGNTGLGVQLDGGGPGGEAARAVELRVERDGVDFHVFLELGG